MPSTAPSSRRAAGVAAYLAALLAPMAFTALVIAIPGWPKPYSWQYLGLTIGLAVLLGVGPGLVALMVSFAAVIWLRVPPPVHPGAEMFAAIGLCLLALLQRWRLTEAELRRQAEVVRESTMLLRAISDESTDVIFAKDLHGRVRFANPATFAMIGKPPEQVIGHTDSEFLDDKPAAARVMENDRLVMGGAGPVEIEEAIPAADGTQRVWLSRKSPYRDAAGTVIGLLGISRDITARKRASAELFESEQRYRDIAEALQDANEQLRDANHRKTEFIAVLSHELRNPLAPIRYALPLIERTEPSGPAARALEVIHRQVDHLTRLVDDLLDVSRITHGAIELRREEVALRTILMQAAEAASPLMVAARHQFEFVLPEEPIWINADAARLAQVITNLLNNSAKFTQRGGRIELSAEVDGGDAVIRVRDNGIGIPPSMLSAVFEMFRQLNRAEEAEHPGGLGIGLGLAKRLVDLHGGTIEARSPGPTRGAEFIVRVPLVASPAAQVVEGDVTPVNGGRRLKVLVVDDNADLVEMLATVVEWEGHEVRKALDGRSAISAALTFRPDVVLLDLGLPLVGGIDVARELRRHRELAAMRIVALTGWGQAEDRERTAEAGFDHHLTKPTDPHTLTLLLRDYARPQAVEEDAAINTGSL